MDGPVTSVSNMQRLIHENHNSAQVYDRIFLERKERGVDEYDLRRWKKLLRFFDGGRIIDLGCLDSLIPELAVEKAPMAEVWGIDLSEESIKQMSAKYPQAIFQVGDLYSTSLPTGYFNYAILGEVIEHLEDPEKAIAEAFRILKPGGVLALSTPKEEAKEPGAVDNHHHIWSFSVYDIRQMVEPYGKTKTETIGSRYFPYYRYCWPSIISFTRKGWK